MLDLHSNLRVVLADDTREPIAREPAARNGSGVPHHRERRRSRPVRVDRNRCPRRTSARDPTFCSRSPPVPPELAPRSSRTVRCWPQRAASIPHLRLTADHGPRSWFRCSTTPGYVDQLAHDRRRWAGRSLVVRFGRSDAITAMTRRPPDHLAMVPSILRMLMLTRKRTWCSRDCKVIVLGSYRVARGMECQMRARWPEVGSCRATGLPKFTSGSRAPRRDTGHPARCRRLPARRRRVTPSARWTARPAARASRVRCGCGTDADDRLLAPRTPRPPLSGEWLRTGDLGAV
ncbi:hypothetical protein HBB16_17605 [Pseudonocardia sp. MCCB 268]|nr:hypothetical protein [Pseudonocardia cytotoxica]